MTTSTTTALTKRLRVVHTVLQLDVGGMEKLLVEFARYADRSRFDLQFVSLSTRGGVAEEIESLGWPVTAVDEPAGLRPGLVLRLAKLFRAMRADVVHAHNTKPLIYSGPAARLAGVRSVVYTRHGTRRGARRGETVLYRLAAKTARHAVCVSQDSGRLCAKDGVAARKISQIWNGIDLARFHFTGPTVSGPAVMVGRLSPEKGIDTLLRAVRIVVSERPAFRLDVVGDGPCMPSLRRLAGELGLNGCVRFCGHRTDIPALLSNASMCVLASLTEGISLVLLEAMARGLPVVATRVGGNPEVVCDGDTGLLVEAASPAELAGAILRVYDDPDGARRMGERGRKRVELHFDARQMVGAYERLYVN